MILFLRLRKIVLVISLFFIGLMIFTYLIGLLEISNMIGSWGFGIFTVVVATYLPQLIKKGFIEKY